MTNLKKPTLLPLVLAALLAPAFLFAVPSETQDPRDLVRQMVANELHDQQTDHSHWMYIVQSQLPGKEITQEIVEAKQGALSRLRLENGHPLTAEQEQQEDQRIQAFIHNPDALKKQKEDSDRDAQKEQRLLKMLPDGFLYKYEGEEGRNIRLSFRPNPDFRPPNSEARVFHAMEGTMVVDGKEKRLVELRGKLVRDVIFGWGIFGRIHSGGTFAVHQKQVNATHWEPTVIDVHITGKALFFKSINEQQHEVRSDFREIPPDTTLQQAAEMLKEKAKAGALAENAK